MGLSPLGYLAGSPFLALYLRLLGARVGKGCHLGSARLQLPDLLEIADGVSIGYGAALDPYVVKDGWLIMEPIRIGKNAYVGVNSVVMLGGQVGDGATVLEQTLVAQDQVIPNNETWAGSPSRRVADDSVLQKMAARRAPRRWSKGLMAGFVGAFVFLDLLPLLMVGPALLFLWAVSGGDMLRIVAAGPAAGVIFVLSACAVLALSKRVIMPKTPTGVFPLRSWFGLRKWLADNLMNTSLAVTNSLYATLYTSPWLRLLGAKIGPRAEISTVSHVDPDLLVVGAESFVADLAVVGAARHYRGCIALGVTEIGVRTFVGNAALVPSNTRLADNSLLGVQSVPPPKQIKGRHVVAGVARHLPAMPPGQPEVRRKRDFPPESPPGGLPSGGRVPARRPACSAPVHVRPAGHPGGVSAGFRAVHDDARGPSPSCLPGVGPGLLPGRGRAKVARGRALPAACRSDVVALRVAQRADHRTL